jgi:hypothetical protein
MKLLSKQIKNGIPYFGVPKTAAKSSRRESRQWCEKNGNGEYVTRSSNSPASDLCMQNACAPGRPMSILSLTPGADLTLDPTESESTTQDMHGIAEKDRDSGGRGEQVMLEGGCAPYRACRSRLAIAVLHMVPSSASACTRTATTAGNQAGKLTRGDFRASPA